MLFLISHLHYNKFDSFFLAKIYFSDLNINHTRFFIHLIFMVIQPQNISIIQ